MAFIVVQGPGISFPAIPTAVFPVLVILGRAVRRISFSFSFVLPFRAISLQVVTLAIPAGSFTLAFALGLPCRWRILAVSDVVAGFSAIETLAFSLALLAALDEVEFFVNIAIYFPPLFVNWPTGFVD